MAATKQAVRAMYLVAVLIQGVRSIYAFNVNNASRMSAETQATSLPMACAMNEHPNSGYCTSGGVSFDEWYKDGLTDSECVQRFLSAQAVTASVRWGGYYIGISSTRCYLGVDAGTPDPSGDSDGLLAYGGATGAVDGYTPNANFQCLVPYQTVYTCHYVTTTTTTAPASATGDPHLQNLYGERFDLMKPGGVVLIQIPRGQPIDDTLLTVEADARRLGAGCADMYFQTLSVTGRWAGSGLRFDAQREPEEKPKWLKFGRVELKVAHGRTDKGVKYLNFYVKHLGHAGADVGGLLGMDDHTEAATPDKGCVKSMSLAKKDTQDTAKWPDASVATATSE